MSEPYQFVDKPLVALLPLFSLYKDEKEFKDAFLNAILASDSEQLLKKAMLKGEPYATIAMRVILHSKVKKVEKANVSV